MFQKTSLFTAVWRTAIKMNKGKRLRLDLWTQRSL